MRTMTMNVKEINRDFCINFREKRADGTLGRYNAISVKGLIERIGEENAITAIQKASETLEQRFSKKFRKHGEVIFYAR